MGAGIAYATIDVSNYSHLTLSSAAFALLGLPVGSRVAALGTAYRYAGMLTSSTNIALDVALDPADVPPDCCGLHDRIYAGGCPGSVPQPDGVLKYGFSHSNSPR